VQRVDRRAVKVRQKCRRVFYFVFTLSHNFRRNI